MKNLINGNKGSRTRTLMSYKEESDCYAHESDINIVVVDKSFKVL